MGTHPLFLCSPTATCEVNRPLQQLLLPKAQNNQAGRSWPITYFACVCMSMDFVHVCMMFTHVGAHVRVWVHVEVRGWHGMSSSVTLSRTEPRMHCFIQPACSGRGLSPPPEHWARRLAPGLLGIHVVLGIGASGSCDRHALCPPRQLPSPWTDLSVTMS